MRYQIKETLSKEENIQLALEWEAKAKELLSQFDGLLKTANKEFPFYSFGMTKAKVNKLNSPNEVLKRLKEASRSADFIKGIYETRERLIQERERTVKLESELQTMKDVDSELNNLAIKFCLDNGKIFGKDFTIETATQTANDISFWVEVNRREAEIGEDFIEFNGQNCVSECDGWNPQDHRCQCGNRRVQWVMNYKSDFRNMGINPEAY